MHNAATVEARAVFTDNRARVINSAQNAGRDIRPEGLVKDAETTKIPLRMMRRCVKWLDRPVVTCDAMVARNCL